MKKLYERPAIEAMEMELTDLLAESPIETLNISNEETTIVESRELNIFFE